ncbi:MAG: hypothetical protein HC908_16720 [Calothrix sp. SM1_7_51]|nr:hypothetical protein [Calothrix sp. SM1_7_51]
MSRCLKIYCLFSKANPIFQLYSKYSIGCEQINLTLGRAIAIALAQPLQAVLEKYVDIGEPISVIYPQKRHLSAKVRVFVDFMVDLMANLRREGIVE